MRRFPNYSGISCYISHSSADSVVNKGVSVVVGGALRGGGEGTRSASRSRRQVPGPAQVPSAADHLGRRGDVVLLQGEVADSAEAVVLAQSVPVTAREEGPRRTDRSDHDPGQQLVQEQTSERSSGRRQGLQVRDGANLRNGHPTLCLLRTVVVVSGSLSAFLPASPSIGLLFILQKWSCFSSGVNRTCVS